MRPSSNAIRPTRDRPASSSSAQGVAHARPLESELEALERLGFDELRLQWRNRWGRLAPARLSRGLLYRVMAYRIQAEVFGDLDRETKRMLDRLADAAFADGAEVGAAAGVSSPGGSPSASSPKVSEPPLILKPGALLTREWRGRVERVMALEEGFAWNGKTYASLSAAAFAITGVKWNGRRFFFGSGGRGSGGGSGGRRAGPMPAPDRALSMIEGAPQ
jgi:hypothetical protein